MVLGAAGSADTAREAAQQVGAAADALHIEAATRAERATNTAGSAAGKTGNLRRGESRKQSYGGKSESVHGRYVIGVVWYLTNVSIDSLRYVSRSAETTRAMIR